MARYLNVPTLEANFLAPLKTTFDVQGSSLDGGRNGLGEGITMEMTGGGVVTATYEDCKIATREQHEYINWLGARLNGSFRFVNVPIITDWFGPFPIIEGIPYPFVNAIPNANGSLINPGEAVPEATVFGKIIGNSALNAGVVRMRIYRLSRPLRHSDWFSIYHVTKGWRAYRYWEVLNRYSDGVESVEGIPLPYQEYSLALAPPLREAVADGTRVEFARPRFVAKFPAGFTLPSVVEAFFVTQQSIQFTEAF
ncbi:hypothetical protein [Rhizobium sp. NFR03]|uniref:hypothetical protein n=1 Tax=Rhizobium sp. NFR03 TaxID=1566263 RepID=UPI0008C03A38|nr:hypothetical protein [Rhizobium sp. NFR03]SES05396.1 hypothetical protein SAMN03159406_01950 [Rhizobium sp. NFR03]